MQTGAIVFLNTKMLFVFIGKIFELAY